MKLTKISLLFFLSLSLSLGVLFSCNKDYELNAPYENITFVYGALESVEDADGNPVAETVFLRIQKAFLGNDPQTIALEDPNATEYQEKLYVELTGWQNGNQVSGPFVFDTTRVKRTADGDFSETLQLLYYSNMVVDEETTYKLKVIAAGEDITSESIVVESFGISRPGPNEFINIVGDNDKLMRWNRPPNGTSFEVKLSFSYYEVILENSVADTNYKTIVWYSVNIPNVHPSDYEIEIYYPTLVFYNSILVKVPYSDPAMESKVIERFTDIVTYRVNAAADQLSKYISVNSPEEGIFQYRPEYSNINNGYGIFSSRNKAIKTKKLGNDTKENIKNLGIKFTY